MSNEFYQFNNKELKGQKVEILEINLEKDNKLKLERIGLFPSTIVEILDDKLDSITIFKINNVKYAIRTNDANNIIVKKVN
ncbi:MAG: ferrous iron transport protein A [Ureaplasma sp.]|nr:ferrous iron transport protein A [Ureaplasma sp.]